jgi:hypothetical protein
MSPTRRCARGTRTGLRLKFVLSAYVLAAVLLPLGHHDIACHLKSSTHCTSCIIGSSAELVADAASITRVRLADAGSATAAASAHVDSVIRHAASGRSPPAL